MASPIPGMNGVPRLLDHTGRPFPHPRAKLPIPDGAARPGGIALPSGWQFIARIGGGDNTFWMDRFDEAMRHSRSDAQDILRDCNVRGILMERMRGVSYLKWHLAIPDEKDAQQIRVKDGLTRLVKSVKNLQSRIIPWLDEGCWYGRAGVQLEWKWGKLRDDPVEEEDEEQAAMQMMRQDPILRYLRNAVMQNPEDLTAKLALQDRKEELGMPRVPPRKQPQGSGGHRYIKGLGVKQAWPVQGDKIGHQFDGTPFILVESSQTWDLPEASIINSNIGRALSLRGTWRERFIISRWFMEDRDFFAAEEAEAVFGVGIRSHIWWLWWLRQEWLGNITDFFSRVGLGVNLWKYSSGNEQALQAVQKAAQQNTDRANIFIPVVPGEEETDTLSRVEVPTSGAEALLKLIEYADKAIERYIVGQEGSASATSSSGHSNKSSADFMRDTKANIIKQDALFLAEALTGDEDNPGLLSVMQKYTYPEADFPVTWEFDLENLESTERLTAIKTLVDMGVEVKKSDARDAAGVSAPADGDEVIQPPQPPGAEGGMPGAPGAGGEGGEDPMAALMGGAGGGDEQAGAAPAEVDENGLPKPPPGLPALAPENDEEDFAGPGRNARKAKHEFGCALLKIPEPLAGKIRRMAKKIKSEDLAEDGREDSPHVTALCGFHGGVDAARVGDALVGRKPIKARLGPVSIFPGRGDHKFDVVKIEVESPELDDLHKALKELPNTQNFPEFNPHLTLGCVKAGKGKHYASEKHPLMGEEVVFDTLHFNHPEHGETELPLGVEGAGDKETTADELVHGMRFLRQIGSADLADDLLLAWARRYAMQDRKGNLHDEKTGRFVSPGKGQARNAEAAPDPEREIGTNPAGTRPAGKEKAVAEPEGTSEHTPVRAPREERTAQPDRAMSPRERREALAYSPAKRSDVLGGGCNSTALLELEDGSMGVFKPGKGEMAGLRGGVRAGTYYKREIAASSLAEILGFDDMVPTTTLRRQGTQEGSIQRFVGGAPEAADVEEEKRFDGPEDAGRAAAFDYLIGNMDRHAGNWLLKDGKLVLIDNGLAFPEVYYPEDYRNVQFLRKVADADVALPDLTGLRNKWPEMEEALVAAGIEPEAINLTADRFEVLTRKPNQKLDDLPAPGGGVMRDLVNKRWPRWTDRKARGNWKGAATDGGEDS